MAETVNYTWRVLHEGENAHSQGTVYKNMFGISIPRKGDCFWKSSMAGSARGTAYEVIGNPEFEMGAANDANREIVIWLKKEPV